jgi:hypothetical protein
VDSANYPDTKHPGRNLRGPAVRTLEEAWYGV